MSEIYIHYGNLEDSVKKSQKVRSEIAGYVDEIKRRITTPISNLDGNDSAGYASTASSLAWKKIGALNTKANRFQTYEGKVTSLISTAKTKDNYVSSQIETIASLYVKKRKWYQSLGDCIYNFFCVDFGNRWNWTRGLSDGIKWVTNKIGNAFEPIVDWFKYGDGKYVWNIVSAVVGTVVAIGGAIAAICAIPFTGGATIPIVIGCISAAAATVGAVITAVNSVTSVIQNSKAIAKSGNLFDSTDGDPSAARHYGSQTKLSTWISKTDLGDKKANEKAAKLGDFVDKTKMVADVTSLVCSIANLGVVRDYRVTTKPNINANYNKGKWYNGYSFKWDNIKRNLLHDMGFKVSGELDGQEAFGVSKNLFAEGYNKKKFTLTWGEYKFKIGKKTLFSIKGGSWSASEKAIKIFRGSKVVKNITDIGQRLDTLGDATQYRDTGMTWTNFWDATESILGLGSNMKITKPGDDFVGKTIKNIRSIIKVL